MIFDFCVAGNPRSFITAERAGGPGGLKKEGLNFIPAPGMMAGPGGDRFNVGKDEQPEASGAGKHNCLTDTCFLNDSA